MVVFWLDFVSESSFLDTAFGFQNTRQKRQHLVRISSCHLLFSVFYFNQVVPKAEPGCSVLHAKKAGFPDKIVTPALQANRPNVTLGEQPTLFGCQMYLLIAIGLEQFPIEKTIG